MEVTLRIFLEDLLNKLGNNLWVACEEVVILAETHRSVNTTHVEVFLKTIQERLIEKNHDT